MAEIIFGVEEEQLVDSRSGERIIVREIAQSSENGKIFNSNHFRYLIDVVAHFFALSIYPQ